MAETRPNDWDEVAARLLAHAEAGTTDSAPAPCSVPVADYADPVRCDFFKFLVNQWACRRKEARLR